MQPADAGDADSRGWLHVSAEVVRRSPCKLELHVGASKLRRASAFSFRKVRHPAADGGALAGARAARVELIVENQLRSVWPFWNPTSNGTCKPYPLNPIGTLNEH